MTSAPEREREAQASAPAQPVVAVTEQGGAAPGRPILRATLGALADFALVYLGGGLLAAIAWLPLVAAGVVPEPDAGDPGILGATLLAGFVIALVLASLRLRREGDSLARDWLRLRTNAGVRRLALVALAVTLVNHALGTAAERAGLDFSDAVNQQAVIAFAHTVPAALALLSIGLVMPFFEELVFRRLMYERFLAARAPRAGAVIVSLAFVAMHSPLAAPPALAAFLCLVYGALSLALCWTYARTRSVLAAFAVHAANNVVAVALVLAS